MAKVAIKVTSRLRKSRRAIDKIIIVIDSALKAIVVCRWDRPASSMMW